MFDFNNLRELVFPSLLATVWQLFNIRTECSNQKNIYGLAATLRQQFPIQVLMWLDFSDLMKTGISKLISRCALGIQVYQLNIYLVILTPFSSDTFWFDISIFWHLLLIEDSDTFCSKKVLTPSAHRRFWHIQILTLPGFDPSVPQILTLSGYIKFWPSPVLTLSNSDTFRIGPKWPKIGILTLSDSDNLSPATISASKISLPFVFSNFTRYLLTV